MSSKIREALEELIANIEMRSSTFGLNVMVDTKTFLDAKAALGEPALNCEVGTAEEQIARYRKFCGTYDCKYCPCNKGEGTLSARCFARWAQMPYEGEVKEIKK